MNAFIPFSNFFSNFFFQSVTPPHFAPGKDPVPILQEAGWTPGPVWTGGKSRPHRDSIPDRPARSQSLYRLSYPAHINISVLEFTWMMTDAMPEFCCYRLGRFNK